MEKRFRDYVIAVYQQAVIDFTNDCGNDKDIVPSENKHFMLADALLKVYPFLQHLYKDSHL